MNRLLYILLISFLTILGFSMYEQKDLGSLSFRFAGHAFETNLVVFTAALLAVLFAVLAISRLLTAIRHFFRSLGNKHKKQLAERAQTALTRGMLLHAEGQFAQAEKALLQHVAHNNNPLAAYLLAAHAAQQLGAYERRDEYLGKAYELAPDAEVAIGLAKAELQLAHKQYEQALATLTHLHQQAPTHSRVLSLLASSYQQLQDWDSLAGILPTLKKHGRLSADSLNDYEQLASKGQLQTVAREQNPAALISFWQQIDSRMQQQPEILEHYARLLLQLDAAGEAEDVLRKAIHHDWHDSLITLYSELDVKIDNRDLETVESWLQQHPHNASLLLALGKRCIALSLWGKARNYLEASIAIRPVPEGYLRLARLLEENMNDLPAAQEYYRQGLHLLAGDYGKVALEHCEHDYQRETPQLKIVKS